MVRGDVVTLRVGEVIPADLGTTQSIIFRLEEIGVGGHVPPLVRSANSSRLSTCVAANIDDVDVGAHDGQRVGVDLCDEVVRHRRRQRRSRQGAAIIARAARRGEVHGGLGLRSCRHPTTTPRRRGQRTRRWTRRRGTPHSNVRLERRDAVAVSSPMVRRVDAIRRGMAPSRTPKPDAPACERPLDKQRGLVRCGVVLRPKPATGRLSQIVVWGRRWWGVARRSRVSCWEGCVLPGGVS